MRILCVIDSLGPGGAQRQLVELALGFKEEGHTVSFLTYHQINFYTPTLQKNDIPITCICEKNYLKRLLKMRRFIRRGRYDSVLSFLEAANLICEIAGLPYRSWKLVVGERSADPAILKSTKLRIFRWLHVFADYVVANSYTNIKIVKSANPILSKSKCKVIYNIVNFDLWKPSLNYYPLKDGKLKLIVVASHRYLKNLNGLIEALALLSNEERSKISVDWYGDRITEPFFDNSIADAKQKITFHKLNKIITFYPATREIIQKVQEADTIGLFSFYEGLPNTICEGMACGKPIICSEISDMPELLSIDKNLLCDPSDPQSIKNAIIYLIGLSKEQLINIGEGNEKICKEKFAKEIILSDYLKLLSS